MIEYLLIGVALGLSAGFAPGPLTAFVVAQSLRFGAREGIKAAAAPLVTDLPIIAVSLLLVSCAADSQRVLGGVSVLGAGFVVYLAWECWRAPALAVGDDRVRPQSLLKAATLNALSPHPYLFWLLVGAVQVTRAWQQTPAAAIAFVGGFYTCLCGSKALIALATAAARQHLLGRPYRVLMRALGVLLLLAALVLVRDGLRLLQP